MKKLLLFVTACMLLSIPACTVDVDKNIKGDEPEKQNPLPDNPDESGEIVLTGGAARMVVYDDEPQDAARLSFTTTEAWTLALSGVTRAEPWLRVFMSGTNNEAVGGVAGEYSLTVVLDNNTTGDKRSAIIVIRSGETVQEIVVTQDPRTVEEAKEDGDYQPRPGDEPENPDDPQQYGVTVTSGGNGSYSIDLEEMEDGSTLVHLTAIPAVGYQFKEWIVISGGVTIDEQNSFVMPDEDVEIRVEFEIAPVPTYTVTVTGGDGGSVQASVEEAVEGDVVTLVATPIVGYLFKQWVVVEGEVSIDITNNTFLMPSANVEIRAEFAPAYEVTVTSGDNGTASADYVQAMEGTSVKLTAMADEGYRFDRWVVVSGGVSIAADNTFTMPDGAVEVRAEFVSTSVWDGFSFMTDPVFKSYCEKFDTNDDNILSREECAVVTTISLDIYVGSMGIHSLDGIEIFSALEWLSCSRNELSTLDVSQNSALKTLRCDDNNLTSLDIRQNSALEYLSCDRNEIASLNVSQNTELKFLICRQNRLSTLDVSQNAALETLFCSHNDDLTSLDLSHNSNLRGLECGYSGLTSLDVRQNVELNSLSCSGLSLASLNLDQNTKLTGLECIMCDLTTLDVSHNTELVGLFCRNNNLSTLDIGNLTKLERLMCYSNRIATLDISQNLELIELYCGQQRQANGDDMLLTLTMAISQSEMWEAQLSNDEHNQNFNVTTIAQ